MHRPDGGSHVDSPQVELTGKDISEGRAAGNVGMVDEILAVDTSLITKGTEDSRTVGIGHILAVGVDLHYRSLPDERMVGRIIFVVIIGMPGMRVIGGNHETACHGAIERLRIIAADFSADPFKNLAKHRRVRSCFVPDPVSSLSKTAMTLVAALS